jgi:hypothetical protein
MSDKLNDKHNDEIISIELEYNQQLEQVKHFFDDRKKQNESGLDPFYEEELTKLAILTSKLRLAKIIIDDNLTIGDIPRGKFNRRDPKRTEESYGQQTTLKLLTPMSPVIISEQNEDDEEDEEEYVMCGNPTCTNFILKNKSNRLQFCDDSQCYEIVHRDKAKELQREKRNFNPQCKTKGCEKDRRTGSSWCSDECEADYTRQRKSENKKKERSKKAKVDSNNNEIKV